MSVSFSSTAISALAGARGITEVVHYSTNLGLLGCLQSGFLLPRNRLLLAQQLSYIATLNTPVRHEERSSFDKSEEWIDYINLSISEINSRLFRFSTQKWHLNNEDIFWIILSFDVSVLDDPGVYFASTNNIYDMVTREEGAAGFQALFAPIIRRKHPTWRAVRGGRENELTTCEQAEVLYPAGLDIANLRRVYVRTGEHADTVHAIRAGYGFNFEIVESRRKFDGRPN